MNKIVKNIIGIASIMLLFGSTALAQIIGNPLTIIEELPSEIQETSGLIFINGKLWTHNDSGGESILYSIDTTTGEILDRKTISGVTNEDWEDIAKDDTYLYIGNFGAMSNNFQIVRISLEDLENTSLNSIQPSIISFTYGNPDYPEENFEATNTRFDCEAFIAKDNMLYLFSKNWIDHKSYLYAIPNTPGETHTVTPIDTLELTYLVCGADYDRSTNTIALVGYTYNLSGSFPESRPYITLLRNFVGNDFFGGSVETIEMPATPTDDMIMFNQTEGITFRDSSRLWVSNEKFTYGSYLTIVPKLRQYTITEPTIINNCDALTVEISGSLSVCEGTTTTLTANVEGGTETFTYMWNNDATTSEITTPALSETTQYSVTVTDANSCSASANVTVTVNPLPEVGITNNTGTAEITCSTTEISLLATGGTTYVWSNSETTAENAITEAGTYTVTATDDNGCSATASVEITQPEALTATASAEPILYNGGTTTASVNVSGGTEPYEYLWSNGATTQTITDVTAGTYSVTVSDANDCTASSSVEISEPTAITATASKFSVYPNPTTERLQIENIGAEYTYSISTLNGSIIIESDVQNEGKSEIDLSVLPKGTYTITISTNETKKTLKFIKL